MKATTKITYDNSLQEYRVRLFVDGVYQAGADYFTDDKEDAIGTAKYMIRNATQSDKNTAIAKAEQKDYDTDQGGYAVDIEPAHNTKVEYSHSRNKIGEIQMVRYKDELIWDIHEGTPDFIIMVISLFTKRAGGLLNF